MIRFALAAALLSLASPAAAEPRAEPRPEPRAEPRAEPGAYRRDGFYVRIEVGAGLFRASSETPDRSSRSFSGTTASWLLAVGGTSSGLVIGGALLRDRVFGLSGEDSETGELDLEDVDFSTTLVGPYLNVYPDPTGGFHLQGMLAVANLDVHRRRRVPTPGSFTATEPDDDPSGIGFMLGAGYEWWLAPQTSAGLVARISYSSLEVDELPSAVGPSGKTSVEVFVPTIALVATYH